MAKSTSIDSGPQACAAALQRSSLFKADRHTERGDVAAESSRSPERGVYGREDIPGFWDAFVGVWESVRSEPVWSFRDRRIARITFFQDRREALEAAGLSEAND